MSEMTTTLYRPTPDERQVELKQYECPKCHKMNSMWPVFEGRKRYYRCDECGTNYSTKQLDKAWGVNKNPTVTALGI